MNRTEQINRSKYRTGEERENQTTFWFQRERKSTLYSTGLEGTDQWREEKTEQNKQRRLFRERGSTPEMDRVMCVSLWRVH